MHGIQQLVSAHEIPRTIYRTFFGDDRGGAVTSRSVFVRLDRAEFLKPQT